jgi:anti-sigma factor RsiW
MSDHLSPGLLHALADGELSAEQMGIVNEHLGSCPLCTSNALAQTLLKTATARAGQRYVAPPQLEERMRRALQMNAKSVAQERVSPDTPTRWVGFSGWVAAAILIAALSGWGFVQRYAHRASATGAENAALVTEISDQHIATLAASLPPQVVSSDRHTVKPWFQGKIPFTFNLPENLPANTKLDGANLTYLHDRPVAQLLYSIGQHRVSVFVQEKVSADEPGRLTTERSGFQIAAFNTGDLKVIAISDVDASRLSELMKALEQAQK